MDGEQMNIPSLDIKPDISQDIDLENAMKQAEATKTITPLIKQELKYTILNRRHQSGQGDVVMEERKTPVAKTLTPEEIRKKLKRKEQNRRAAQRCREKKKRLTDLVLNEYLQEQKTNKDLLNENEKLKREKETLLAILQEHSFKCCRPVTPNPVSPPYENSATFNYGVSPVPCFQRETVTPQETFDDHVFFQPTGMTQKESPVPVAQTAAENEFSDLDIVDFLSFDGGCFQPTILENGGRRSISDYADLDGHAGTI